MDKSIILTDDEIIAEKVGALIKRFGELVIENERYKQKLNSISSSLSDRKNKLVLQNAHYLRVEGFDLAMELIKQIINNG